MFVMFYVFVFGLLAITTNNLGIGFMQNIDIDCEFEMSGPTAPS